MLSSSAATAISSATAAAAAAAAAVECIPLMSGSGGRGEYDHHQISLSHLVQQHQQQPPHSPTSSLEAPTIQQQQSPLGQTSATANTNATATPVISLFKLKNFLYQPKFKNLLHGGGGGGGAHHGHHAHHTQHSQMVEGEERKKECIGSL